MVKRTLYFGNPAYLHKRQQQLKVIKPNDDTELGSIPIEDIGVVVLDNPRITLSHALMQAFIENNVALITCNEKHHPSGLMLNLDGHSAQAERFRYQIEATEPLKKQLWQQTIHQKVKNQAEVLRLAGQDNKKLLALLPQIKSGDSTNVEARAAAVYWKLLLGKDFIRDRYGLFPNSHLNYIYAILRAMVARALVSSGLLPTLGIFHSNKYNAYALADDVMEPYRPFADLLVYHLMEEGEIDDDELSTDEKAQLLSVATLDVNIAKRKSPLMMAISRTTSSLEECFEGKRRRIIYPELS